MAAEQEAEAQETRSSDGLDEQPDGSIEVPEESDDDVEEERLTRAEKKRLRYDEAQRAAQEARAEAARERQIREDYERRLMAIEQQHARAAQEAGDPYDRELARLEREERAIYSRKPTTKEEADKFADEAFMLRRRQNELAAEKVAMRAMQAAQQSQPNPFASAMMARYPEVFGDQKAFRWATAREAILLAEAGQAPNPQTVERALREARERFFSDDRGRRDVSESERSRYSGMSRGGSGGEAPKARRLSRAEFQMARALRPDLEPQDAAKHFLKNVKNKNA